jgi:hypothetical protein
MDTMTSNDFQFEGRLTFPRLFHLESPGEPKHDVEEIELLQSVQDSDLETDIRRIDLEASVSEKDDISEYLANFAERFDCYRYRFETRSKRHILTDEGKDVTEKTIRHIETTHIFWSPTYVILLGSHSAVDAAVSIARRLAGENMLREITIGPNFLEWFLYNQYTNQPIRPEFSFQRITKAETSPVASQQGDVRDYHSLAKNSDCSLENLLIDILNGRNITQVAGEFEVAGYEINANIRESEGVNIYQGQGSLDDSSDLRRLLLALRFLYELVDTLTRWDSWPREKRKPPVNFYTDIYQSLEGEGYQIEGGFEELPGVKGVRQNEPRDIYAESDADALTEDINDLLECGESETIEFKKELPGHVESIAKEIVALANYKGGVLLLGVQDDGTIVGLRDVEDVEERVSNILRDNTRPPVQTEIEFHSKSGKDVLSIRVQQFRELPHAVSYRFYTRIGTTKRKLTPYEISYLMPDRESEE